jgi:hypothetical protein
MFIGITPVLFRISAILEALVACEYIAISLVTPAWTGEMKSVWHAWRTRRASFAGAERGAQSAEG